MKRINPLYIALLLVVIFVFVSIKLDSANFELSAIKDDYKNVSLISSKVSGLKSTYSNKVKIEKSIKNILKLSVMKSANIEYEMKKNSILLSSKSMNKNTLNILMGRLLNRSYNIHSFEINKLSDTKVFFKMEIKC